MEYFEKFSLEGIEGGIFFDDEMQKKPENRFFGLNLTKSTLI